MRSAPRHIISGGDDENVKWINVETGNLDHEVGIGVKIFHMCQLSDDEFCCSEYDHDIRIFNYESRSQVRTLSGHTNNTKGLCFDAPSQMLFSGSQDNTIRVWEMPAGTCKGTLSGHSGTIYALATIPTVEGFIFSTSYDNSVRKWDWRTMQHVSTGTDHSNDVECVTGACEEKILFTGADDNKAIFWDATNLTKTSEVQVDSSVYALCYRVLKHQLIVGSNDGKLSIYDIRNTGTRVGQINGHSGGDLWGLCDLIEPDCFVSTSWGDESVRCWDGETFERKWSYDCSQDMTGAFPHCVPFDDYLSAQMGRPLRRVVEVDITEERTQFVVEPPTPGLLDRYRILIKAQNQEFSFAKSFLVSSEKVTEDMAEITIDESLDVKPDVLLALLAGDESKINNRHLMDYYHLFRELGMKKLQFLVVEKIAKIENLAMVVFLCDKAFKRYEAPQQQDDDQFSDLMSLMDGPQGPGGYAAAFTVACLNMLKKNIDQVDSNVKLKRACVARNIMLPVMTHRHIELKSLPEFGFGDDETLPRDFAEASAQRLAATLDSKACTNVALVGTDGEVTAHIDILITRNEAFFQKMKSDEDVASAYVSTGKIPVEGLSKAVLEQYVRFVYTDEMDSEDLLVLMQILAYGLKVSDEGLEAAAEYHVGGLTRILKRDGTLRGELERCTAVVTGSDAMRAKGETLFVEPKFLTAAEWSSVLGGEVSGAPRASRVKKTPVPEATPEAVGRIAELEKAVAGLEETLRAILARVERLES